MSYKLASKGDVVLLSPACASFDLFQTTKIEVFNLKPLLELYNHERDCIRSKTFSINRETDHNFEFVATINDVTFINDSKATNAKHAGESINSLDAEIVSDFRRR